MWPTPSVTKKIYDVTDLERQAGVCERADGQGKIDDGISTEVPSSIEDGEASLETVADKVYVSEAPRLPTSSVEEAPRLPLGYNNREEDE